MRAAARARTGTASLQEWIAWHSFPSSRGSSATWEEGGKSEVSEAPMPSAMCVVLKKLDQFQIPAARDS